MWILHDNNDDFAGKDERAVFSVLEQMRKKLRKIKRFIKKLDCNAKK
jgi:hypothetical protein